MTEKKRLSRGLAATVTVLGTAALRDMGDRKKAVASVLMPDQEQRWLGVWEQVTGAVSRRTIGVVVIATMAGTRQGVTAWLLGSSPAIALGLIAQYCDMSSEQRPEVVVAKSAAVPVPDAAS